MINQYKKHIKIYIFSLLCCLFFGMSNSNAQQQPPHQKSEFWKHVRYGGGIGLSFGNNFFSGTLAPSALYSVNQTVSLGLGLNATYESRKNQYNSTVLGASLIALINPVREIQLSIEFEELHINRKYDNYFDEKYWNPALFLGAGYNTGNVAFGIRYDVLHDHHKSIYSEAWVPFIRFYF